MKKLKSRKGFTLIELVVTVAILSIVCCMGVGIFASVMRNYGTASSTEMEQEKATQIETYLVKAARTAAKVECFDESDTIPSAQGTYIFSKVGSSDVEIYDIVPKSSTDTDKISIIKVSGVKKLSITVNRQNVVAASKEKFAYMDYTIEMINGYTVKGSVVMKNFKDSGTVASGTQVDTIKSLFEVCVYDESSASTAADKAILFVK